MQDMVVIGWNIPKRDKRSGLGVVDAIRDAAQAVKVHHPHLKDCLLKDVALKHGADEIRLTFYFSR